jgi:hypothetical protein
VGFRAPGIELISWEAFTYCASLIVRSSKDNFVWRLLVVYESPCDESKLEFLEELDSVLGRWQGSTLLGGDFNLVRSQREKSNGIVNFRHMEAFNDLINRWSLIEIKDPTRTFSWSNNQAAPINAKLDRILASVKWDSKYPFARVTLLPKEVSDHNPIRISFEERAQFKEHVFRFKKWWLEMEDFTNLVQRIWETNNPCSDPIRVWQFKIRLLRKKIKGWNRNMGVELKKSKSDIITNLDGLDKLSEQRNLTTDGLERRKELSLKLKQIWRVDEIKAKKRSRDRYIK